jgi:hypothetical protein
MTTPNLEGQGTRYDLQFLLHMHGTGIIFQVKLNHAVHGLVSTKLSSVHV